MDEPKLILKRASLSRPSTWDDDDYEVLHNSEVVGRIFKTVAVAPDRHWFWCLGYGHHRERWPISGYEATREDAMAAFKKSWLRQ
jgi:hypothetical protein